MTSSKMEEAPERPRKRQRLQTPPQQQSSTSSSTIEGIVKPIKKMTGNGFQPERELEVGILHFVNGDSLGFTGTLKQRYTDFLVNEIAPDGTVVHLTDDRAPQNKGVVKDSKEKEPLTDATNGAVKGDKLSVVSKPEDLPLPPPTPSEKEATQAPLDVAATEGPVSQVVEAPSSTNDEAPKNKVPFAITPEDDVLLANYFGSALKSEIIEFHKKILSKPTAKPASFGSLLSEPITDRPLRGRLHADVRRIFESRIETASVDEKIELSAAPPIKPHPEGYVRNQNPREQNPRGPNRRNQGQSKGKLGWQELGGEHLHFSLYKENKDTMEVISALSRALRVKHKDFAFAGTKDRRAVTVQRVSVFRQRAHAVQQVNFDLRNARVGDFKYEKFRLELGELQGNQFVITLRDCHFGETDDTKLDDEFRLELAKDVVGKTVKGLQSDGFINYFGLQRFGTFGIGTDEIGKKILKEDFEGAVWDILHFSKASLDAAEAPDRYDQGHDRIGRDDLDRALAIANFKETGKAHYAVEKLPRKFSAESAIIRQLGFRPTDFLGALNNISRNLRTMYVHAYQSLVWNVVVSERWSRYGGKVIKGDLILVETPAEKAAEARDDVDENGEVVIHASADDAAITHDDLFQRARALSAEEAESGKYSIFDVVLPTPGFDIEYPDNDIGDFYKEFMGSERGGGLDPADMRRKVKDFSLSGSYRKMVAQVGKDLSFELKVYHDDVEQLVETDWEKLQKSRGQDPHAQVPRFDNRRDNNDNQNGRGGRGGRGNRGGRQNDFYNNRGDRAARENDYRGAQYSDVRLEDVAPAQPTSSKITSQQQSSPLQTSAKAASPSSLNNPRPENKESVAAKMEAWNALPEKLAIEDKAAAAVWDATPLRNPDEIYQPVYKDTYIETSADDEGRRTGFVTTDFIDTEGKLDKQLKVKPESALAGQDVEMKDSVVIKETEIAAPQTTEIDMKGSVSTITATTTDNMDTSFDTQEGGVPLSHPEVPPEATEEDSKSVKNENDKGVGAVASIDQPVGDNSYEIPEEQPAKIAVVIRFALGTSQYATMALRELMKLGGVKTYKPDYSMGR